MGPLLIDQRYPRGAWSPFATTLALSLAVIPVACAALMTPSRGTIEGVATAVQFVLFPVLMMAGLVLTFYYRAVDSVEAAWVATCLMAYAVPGSVLAGMRLFDGGHPTPRESGWILVVHLPLGLVLLVILLVADHLVPRLDPIMAGFLAGLVVAAACIGAYRLAPDLSATAPWLVAVDAAVIVIGIAIAVATRKLRAFPVWCSDRLALGALALVANLVALAQPPGVGVHMVTIGTAAVAAVAIADAAAALLRGTLVAQHDAVLELVVQVEAMEAGDRDSQARLHEITNSIAGIAVASSLIHSESVLSPGQRQRLEEMLDSESHRLARVLGGERLAESVQAAESRPDVPDRPSLDLDGVIRPIVTSHRALRRKVSWQPSGHLARADADAVAEVVNILVDNAARHAPDSEIAVEVNRVGASVEIAVRDNGPGIPAEVRRRLFERGGRGPESNGHGIGLFLAQQIMSIDGHSLRLDMDTEGTTFVIELPLMS